MRYTEIILNGQKFQMSAISLGTVWFGSKTTKEMSFAMMDTYTGLGGNWIDTARLYGYPVFPEHELKEKYDSEEVIGEWMKSRGNRNDITLITKGANTDMRTGVTNRLNADAIRYDMETSLKALKTSWTDIYFLHTDDENVPVEEIMPVLHELVQSGKTRVIGASNWRVSRIEAANQFAMENGLTPFSLSQVRWSYALPCFDNREKTFDMELDPTQYEWYRKEKMPIMAYSSQARGFFLKTAENGFEPENIGRSASYLNNENINRAKAVHAIAKRLGISTSAAAMSYLWGKEVPVTALCTGNTPENIRKTLEDCDFYPSEDVIKELENAKNKI